VNAPTITLDGHPSYDDQRCRAVEGPTSRPTRVRTTAKLGSSGGTPTAERTTQVAPPIAYSSARGSTPPAPAIIHSTATPVAPVLADPLLALASDVLDDLERVRIANENRLRQLTRDETDSDGEERGFGLTLDHPDVKRLAALVDALAKAEHDAELNLKRQLGKHPLGPWVKQARGVGEKQAARLLTAVGDPYWNDLHDRPRTVSELWSYCGYHVLRVSHMPIGTHLSCADAAQLPAGQSATGAHSRTASGGQAGGSPDQEAVGAHSRCVGVAATRARGQKANWSADAKMRAYLVAVSIVKAGGPYREVYDGARAKYDGAIHQAECKRCGPKGNPAQPGSPISAGHQHARAVRLVAKTVLKDLWREAKRLHEDVQDDDQGVRAPQRPTVSS
jgi:hypothetical protein